MSTRMASHRTAPTGNGHVHARHGPPHSHSLVLLFLLVGTDHVGLEGDPATLLSPDRTGQTKTELEGRILGPTAAIATTMTHRELQNSVHAYLLRSMPIHYPVEVE